MLIFVVSLANNYRIDNMTFKEFLKQKKGIDTSNVDPMDFMDEYYDEYTEYLSNVKDGCGPQE
ncbi:MAG: hypothetical protein Q8P28_06025 [Deltaproteobacteria bacterium]|nr:hypothetical protein [Deltaproteobacteria bacterium]